MYNRLYEYFTENELISSSVSDFKPENSCIDQLISITHDIYQSFDNRLKLGVSSLTYVKLLTEFDIKRSYLLNTLANFKR